MCLKKVVFQNYQIFLLVTVVCSYSESSCSFTILFLTVCFVCISVLLVSLSHLNLSLSIVFHRCCWQCWDVANMRMGFRGGGVRVPLIYLVLISFGHWLLLILFLKCWDVLRGILPDFKQAWHCHVYKFALTL